LFAVLLPGDTMSLFRMIPRSSLPLCGLCYPASSWAQRALTRARCCPKRVTEPPPSPPGPTFSVLLFCCRQPPRSPFQKSRGSDPIASWSHRLAPTPCLVFEQRPLPVPERRTSLTIYQNGTGTESTSFAFAALGGLKVRFAPKALKKANNRPRLRFLEAGV
jgi:hypothetical protein